MSCISSTGRGAPRLGLAILAVGVLVAGCGNDDTDADATTPTRIAIGAEEYRFDAPATVQGGVVEIDLTNRGAEPHIAGLARVPRDGSFAAAKAALVAPLSSVAPPAPPPFEDVGGVATTDPGASAKVTLELPSGTYLLFCLLPSPDGISHAAKGMVHALTVTDGPSVAPTEATATITATDLAFDRTPPLTAGTATVRLRNQGRQLHEINSSSSAEERRSTRSSPGTASRRADRPCDHSVGSRWRPVVKATRSSI